VGQPSPPSAPDPAKTFQEGLQTWLKYLPTMLKREQQYRTQYDPQRIAEQQALQAKFGPTQYAQQLAALQQLDPLGVAMRGQLGQTIQQALTRGNIDPGQAAVFGQLGSRVGQALSQGGLDPTQVAAYQALGQGTLGQYNRGAMMDPSLQRDVEQTLAARQGATGAMGNAASMAAAVYTGQRAQQLQQQRTGNLAGFLGLQAPEAAAIQAGAQYSQLQSPEERALAQAGSFLSSPTPEQQVGMIQGVTPDRGFAYVNPNAGYMGQQFGLSNYQNQLAGYNPTNPWAGALTGAASGAISGTMINPGWGTLIGAGIGGLTGYFSDPKAKTGVRKVGNVPIYSYKYRSQFGIPGKFVGPMSSDVKKFAPESVRKVFGKDFVTVPNKLGLNRVKVKEAT